ncbi:MAG: hypothetical protein DMG29_20390, partial [Acidobacteria bacterium]
FRFTASGEIETIDRATAGYGKVAVLDELQTTLQIGPDQIIYVGDGSSDIHVMLHVNVRDGFTIAVSETKDVTQIAKRTVLSANSLAILVPILEKIVGWERPRIREFFESYGFLIQGWDKVRTDWLTLRPAKREWSAGRRRRLTTVSQVFRNRGLRDSSSAMPQTSGPGRGMQTFRLAISFQH